MDDDDRSTRPSPRTRGQWGEELAARYLIGRGLELIDRNVTAAGSEIDLICRLGETIIFVEVRGRSDDRRGHPLETIDTRKRAQIRRAATAWLVAQGLWERVPVRFDAVALVGDDIEWVADAFY